MKNLMEEVKLNDELQWLFFLFYQFHPSVAWPQWKCPFTSAYKPQFPLKWWDRSGWYSSMWDQTKSDHFVQIDLFLVNWWRSVSPWFANFHCSQPIRLELQWCTVWGWELDWENRIKNYVAPFLKQNCYWPKHS